MARSSRRGFTAASSSGSRSERKRSKKKFPRRPGPGKKKSPVSESNPNRPPRRGSGLPRGKKPHFAVTEPGETPAPRVGRRNEMHKAVCDECGRSCEVPFRPTPGKPVLCRECFKKNKRRPQTSREDSDAAPEKFKTVCTKCKKICEVPFKPERGRDVFCPDCFSKRRSPKKRRKN